MSTMSETKDVQNQYADDKNLAVRIKLHQVHSTNKQGIVPWLFEQYTFAPNARILELGCGNGNQWEGRLQILPKDATLTLTDFSQGMVDKVNKRYGDFKNVSFQQVDIQEIPFDNESFDVIIANHMLYHVPNLPKALSEVKRVLKTDGTFYAATNGNGGLWSYLQGVLHHIDNSYNQQPSLFSFNLQNGQEILRDYFTKVQRIDYKDALAVTCTQDLIDWIKSTIIMADYAEKQTNELYNYFEAIRVRDGAIHIPKEAGLFIAMK